MSREEDYERRGEDGRRGGDNGYSRDSNEEARLFVGNLSYDVSECRAFLLLSNFARNLVCLPP